MEMYHTIYFDERVALSPAELNKMKVAEDVNGALAEKLKAKYEGRCTANGYIRPGTIGIMGRSFGRAAIGDFTGNWLYDCKVNASVLYPTAGSEFQVEVIKVNNMGAYAHFDDAIRILLPRDTHVGNKKFDEIKKGDRVFVRLDRSRFQMNDTYIMAVGTLIDAMTVKKTAAAVATEAVEAEADVEEAAEEAAAEEAEEGTEEKPADRILNPMEAMLNGKKYLYNTSNQVIEIKELEEEPENWDFELYKGALAPSEIQERFRQLKTTVANNTE
jgi:DNA-directed RNA polymerase subunit E'/Rpb7